MLFSEKFLRRVHSSILLCNWTSSPSKDKCNGGTYVHIDLLSIISFYVYEITDNAIVNRIIKTL